MSKIRDPKRAPARGLAPRALLALACALAATPASPQASGASGQTATQTSTGARLEWAAVEGARAYILAVRPLGGGASVYQAEQEGTVADLPLGPGDYEARVSAVNVFRRVFAEGPWSPFSIRRTADPRPVIAEKPALYGGAEAASLKLRGEGILEETRARIVGAGGLSLEGRIAPDGSGGLIATFDLSSVAPGRYSLEVENPGGRTTRLPDALEVLPRARPLPRSLRPAELANDRVHLGVRLEGEGLSEATALVFEGPGGARLAPSRAEPFAGGLELSLNAAELAPGVYDLLAVNPGGLSGRLAGALRLVDALSDRDGAASAEDPELAAVGGYESGDDRPAAYAAATRPARRVWLAAGYRAAALLPGDFSDSLGSSFAGGELGLGLSLRGLFPGSALLGSAAIEFKLDPAYFSGSPGTGSAALAAISVTTVASLSWDVAPALGLSARAGYGLVVSLGERSTPLGSEPLASQDSSLIAGLALRWTPTRLFVELGADWQGIFYVGETVHAARPFLRFGYWLD